MASTNEPGPYVFGQTGSSILETTTILGQLLRPAGYSRDAVLDIAINEFLDNERTNIRTPSPMHLLSVKKTLLYAIPVIANHDSHTGIALTSQVNTPAIQYHNKHIQKLALIIGDKFRLIGFAFPNRLVNHLSIDVFPWKYFHTLPVDHEPALIDISHVQGIDTQKTSSGPIYLINASHYEDEKLFNEVNRIIAAHLCDDMTAILAATKLIESQALPELKRIKPFNSNSFIKNLNEILPRNIDSTYSMSFYEALKMTANWLLYDQIKLLGFESPEVSKQLLQLKYIKEQNIKVQQNLRAVNQQLLLSTRADRLTRERYPHFFDHTDRRAIFVRFNRFSIDKLPKKERNEIQILLEKDLAAQHALLHNKCEHIEQLKIIKKSIDLGSDAYKLIEPYVDHDSVDDNKMYSCKLCSYPLMCIHEVELYEALSSITDDTSGSDNTYWARQKIINKYKLTDQRRTGAEDTEVSFTFYCKHCGGELGKADDIIQATIKTASEASTSVEENPILSSIYLSVSSMVSASMNQSIVPMSKKAITKLIFEEAKDQIASYITRATKNEQDNIDILIRYISSIYTLAALISINLNKLKSPESILMVPGAKRGGAQLKDELIISLKIIQTISVFKRIGVSDDKTKTMLIEAFKFMNRIFSNEALQLKASTPKDRLRLDVQNSPLAAYAMYMQKRTSKRPIDILELLGIDLDVLYPKNKKTAPPIVTHALYSNIYIPKGPESTEIGRYIRESYQSIVDFVTHEPKGSYSAIVAPPVGEFIKLYEHKHRQEVLQRQTTPVRFLPVENSREYDFEIKNYNITYCINEDASVRAHRWVATKTKDKLIFTCKYCNLNIDKAVKSQNEKIEDSLDEQMMIDAFFELYRLTCPIKDTHIFESDKCTQCNISKSQLTTMDPKYYKKYSPTYLERRKQITVDLVKDANSIMEYAKPVGKQTPTPDSKPDLPKLETLATGLSKIFNSGDLKSVGMVGGVRSLEVVDSFVRLFYSHYTFVKNLSIDTTSHPDSTFFSFIKEKYFNGTRPQKIKLAQLPAYPTSSNADVLLTELFQIIYDLASNGDGQVNELIKFIVLKIALQDARHKAFNFAKLKAVSSNRVNDDDEDTTVKIDEEEEFDMFDGYDVDAEDIEDNINGEVK